MTKEKIIQILKEKLAASHVEVVDESDKHRGHAGSQKGGGHYAILVVSTAFEEKPPIARHQLVYKALQMASQEEIHALKMKTLTPSEWK